MKKPKRRKAFRQLLQRLKAQQDTRDSAVTNYIKQIVDDGLLTGKEAEAVMKKADWLDSYSNCTSPKYIRQGCRLKATIAHGRIFNLIQLGRFDTAEIMGCRFTSRDCL